MIDHLIRFDSEDQAKADSVCGAYCIDGTWRADICVAGAVVWRPSDDTQATVDGETVTTRHPLPYWYLLIALPAMDAGLCNHPACMIVADREAGARGDPAFVIYSPIPAGQLGDYMIEPTFAGSQYPFG